MVSAIAGILCLLIWLYLLFAHGGFWRVSRRLPPAMKEISSLRIAVVIPARDEAAGIGRCVAALLQQVGPHHIHVFLVDDGSSDDTADIARKAAEEAGAGATLTVIQGQSLPSGWTGKLWAVHQGIESAREFSPQFLLLTDADILHAPDSIATLVSIAESGPYDLASFMVNLHCASLAERFLIPAFVFFFFKLYPPEWIADPSRKTAGAAGGSILVRREVLERSGGVAAIRSEIIDDCALARIVKNHGGRIWLGLTKGTRSLRPYGTIGEIGRMISRTAFNQLNHSILLLLGSLGGMIVIYLLPVLLLLSGHPIPVTLGAAVCLLMALAYLPLIRFYWLNPLWSLSLPLISIFYMGATMHSAFRYWSGRGGEWKGRMQDREVRTENG
jgi:hopene-associated glycosyltransferase HpnB